MEGGFTSAISIPETGPIAVSSEECQQWGCPYCGYRSASSMISGFGAATASCGECGKTFIVLGEGVTKSAIGIGHGDDVVYPELQDHPRRGVPSHGRPDTLPEEGGEFFHSRGIGLEGSLYCFVCGVRDRAGRPVNSVEAGNGLLNNIAGYVKCKAAGERIVAMFIPHYSGARLDYREYEPDYVQVKIGACNQHLGNLQLLDAATADGRITLDRVNEAAQA